MRGRGPDEPEREPGVVGPAVVIEVCRRDVVAPQRGHVCERLVAVDPAMPLSDAQSAGEVVHPHGGTERASDAPVDQPITAQHWDQERQHPHEVRCIAQRVLTLVEPLVDQPELALLEVADAAVDELGRLRRRAGCKVVTFDEPGAQPTARGVERTPGTGDATTDDEHVELLVGEATQRVGAIEGWEHDRQVTGG